ncbi:hypothetical protein AA313_de0209846 [Arthrobotrys entomopaga]|nr:hypothetical protein AA313_de0209846 [Arthrobotrys entomopaga]
MLCQCMYLKYSMSRERKNSGVEATYLIQRDGDQSIFEVLRRSARIGLNKLELHWNTILSHAAAAIPPHNAPGTFSLTGEGIPLLLKVVSEILARHGRNLDGRSSDGEGPLIHHQLAAVLFGSLFWICEEGEVICVIADEDGGGIDQTGGEAVESPGECAFAAAGIEADCIAGVV